MEIKLKTDAREIRLGHYLLIHATYILSGIDMPRLLKAGLTTFQLLISQEALEAEINDECLALRQKLFNTEARE